MLDVKIGLQNTVYNAQEGDGSISICAEIIEGSLGRDVSVQFSTFDGTALGTYNKVKLIVSLTCRYFLCSDGDDYYNVTGQFIFSSGSIAGDSECVDVGIINDDVLELREFFTFALCSEDSAVNLCIQSADVYIDDEDGRFQHCMYCVRNDGR